MGMCVVQRSISLWLTSSMVRVEGGGSSVRLDIIEEETLVYFPTSVKMIWAK